MFDIAVFIFFTPHIIVYAFIDFILPSIRNSSHSLKMIVLFLTGIPASYLYAIIFIKISKKITSIMLPTKE